MPKLYFKWGCMNSSKTAQALMTKFNYEEKGYDVALMKPSIDNRDGEEIIKSRIGLESDAIIISKDINLFDWMENSYINYDVIIVDEAQFLTPIQVEELKDIAIEKIPVLCFGLRNDFQTKMFPASKRLFEISDSITEIKSICKCGRKAEINMRIKDGKPIYDGNQIEIGGNESYIGVCYSCWLKGKT